MKTLGIILQVVGVLGGLALAGYLGGYLMIYCSIVEAVQGTDLAGNIVTAVFAGGGVFAGFLAIVPLWVVGHLVRERGA